MIVRRAVSGDIESLLPLVRAYRVFYEQQPDPQRERAYVHHHFESGSSVIYIAEEDEIAAGFAQLFRTYSTVHLAPAWILEDLFVEMAFRGRGIAAALLSSAVDHARAEGASGMFLETALDNFAAQRVYERAGWRRESRFLKYNAPLA